MLFKANNQTEFEGGLTTLLKRNRELIEIKAFFAELEVNKTYRSQDVNQRQNREAAIQKILNHETRIISGLSQFSKNLRTDFLCTDQIQRTILDNLDRFEKIINEYYSLLPVIYFRNAYSIEQFPSSISKEEFLDSVNNKVGLPYRLLQAASIEPTRLINAFNITNESGRDTERRAILKDLNVNVRDRFRVFYNHDDYEIEFTFEEDRFKINVTTKNKVLNLHERSNGFRWYFSMFIDMMSNDIPESNTLFILDEPGVFLHVNAQQELIELFEDLCKKGNQVLYATHSPYMLNASNLFNVRAIEKTDLGNTCVRRNIYSSEIDKSSKRDTLSPVLKIIGCDLKFQIGPSSRCNLITEGIVDKLYLEAMITVLGIPKKRQRNIIPSVGADNILNIVSILIGWGCDFRVLLDYDKKGFTVRAKLLKEYGNEIDEKIHFVVNLPPPANPNDKAIKPQTIEDLVSAHDYALLDSKLVKRDSEEKKLVACEFYQRVQNKSIVPDEETKKAFKELFLECMPTN